MYLAIIAAWLGLGAWLVMGGLRRRRPALIGLGAALGLACPVFFWFLGFWGEFLWFNNLGFHDRFWTAFWVRLVAGAGGFLFGVVVVGALLGSLRARRRTYLLLPVFLGGVISASWGYSHWDDILMYLNAVETATVDPVLERSVGFYLFRLPLLESLQSLLLWLTAISLIGGFFLPRLNLERGTIDFDPRGGDKLGISGGLNRCTAALFLVLGLGWYFSRFELMYSQWGAVTGPGWVDVNFRLPGYGLAALAALAAALCLLIAPIRNKLERLGDRLHPVHRFRAAAPPVMLAAGLFVISGLGLGLVPWLAQRIIVEPNEISMEQPYIANNIEFTRKAFGLDKVIQHSFPASPRLDQAMVDRNKPLFNNIRLWDWRVLDSIYQQFQEIRLYYEFVDVDIDRYRFNDAYRQVMVSAREMSLDNLPAQSQTFVNRRFKYTHGYGVTLTGVNKFTSQGLPDLLIRDIPPKSRYPELEVEKPQIYYGELTDTPVVVNSSEKEFDHPSGDGNAFIRYPGGGGAPMGNWWTKFLFGWKFNEARIFFSSYPRQNTRIMFHRNIAERVKRLAPFLKFDADPYIVLNKGRLYWILDGYSTSDRYPYSEPYGPAGAMNPQTAGVRFDRGTYRLRGENYLRNSVKAVVDAFEGSVDFYVFEPDDPIIQVWEKIFPGLFKPKKEMPPGLLAHVRYPRDLLVAQGEVYAKYHMTDPTVFYNQEDLWVRATEKYYGQVQLVEPYYIMWQSPRSEAPEFILMMPFTPKNRQVMVGWIAGMCDGDNYGRFLAYKFSKKRRVLGPQQVESKIDQDSQLSAQLTLWDQRGSKVIRGNVLAIPVEDSLLYVEPIYLQADTAAYPELRTVVVMHQDELSYAETFKDALKGLLGVGKKSLGSAEPPAGPDASAAMTQTGMGELIRQANQAFEDYLAHQAARRFDQAAESLTQLENSLTDLKALSGDASKPKRREKMNKTEQGAQPVNNDQG